MDAERLQDVAFEADYWQALLADVLELNEHVKRMADALGPIPVYLLPSMFVLESPAARTEIVKASAASCEAMALLEQIHEVLLRIVALTDGRARALHGIVDKAGA